MRTTSKQLTHTFNESELELMAQALKLYLADLDQVNEDALMELTYETEHLSTSDAFRHLLIRTSFLRRRYRL